MNDLIDVRDALGQPEPPSHTVQAAARTALLERAAATRATAPARARLAAAGSLRREPHGGPARRFGQRRAGLLATGLGLAAAGVAAIVVVAATGTTAGPLVTGGGHRGTTAIARLSARQILLAAATTAAHAPARAGKYWYIKETGPGPAAKTTTQDWYTHGGKDYHLAPNGDEVYLAGGGGFNVGASLLTYAQIQRLPLQPAALTAWITKSFYHPTGPPSAPGLPQAVYSPPPRSAIPGFVAGALSDLLALDPATPALRAAAFRALAAMPNVTKLGTVDGGVLLRISFPKPPKDKWPGGRRPPGTGEITLTIATAIPALRAVANYQGTTTFLAARWTNTRPPVVSVNKLFPAKQKVLAKLHKG